MSIKKDAYSTNVFEGFLLLLVACCFSPELDIFRGGFCRTDSSDVELHTICLQMMNNLLVFRKTECKNLITPKPVFLFPGLKAGDR